MATSFSGGGSRSTRREPPTMGKQLVNFITCSCESSALFFCLFTKPGLNPRRIGDRLVWVVRSSDLTHWAIRVPRRNSSSIGSVHGFHRTLAVIEGCFTLCLHVAWNHLVVTVSRADYTTQLPLFPIRQPLYYAINANLHYIPTRPKMTILTIDS